MNFKKAFIALGATLAIAGCSSTRNRTESVENRQPVTPTKQAAADMDSNVVSTITFEEGKRGVNGSAAQEIDRAISEAKQKGEIDRIDVAVWSDMEYPGRGHDLPKNQVNLADDRGDNIEKYIDAKAPEASVRVHNMAKEPNALARFVNTRDAKLKEKLTSMGVTPNNDNTVDGRASSALVFIKLKE
jgi:hypothetical protein